jgi:hypothetical protein
MKRAIFVCLIACLALAAAFAGDFTVKAVTGKVEREVSPGKWEAVKEGQTLQPSAVINTGLNASLVLNDGAKDITVKAMQKGTVEALTKAGVAGGVKIGGKIATSNTDAAAKGASNVSTASTRASDAAKDVEWAED